MTRKTAFPLLLLLFLNLVTLSQVSVKDSSIFTPMFYATYSYQWPGGDLSTVFGSNSSIGGGFMIKTKSNWLFGIEGNFLFGENVKISDVLLSNIATSEGFVLDANGFFADVYYYERGYSFYAKFGKVIPVLSPNPNSGFTIMAGGGYIQDKIRIHTSTNDVPQIAGDYLKGYDHLNSGFAVNGSLGYLFMSNSRLLNFYLGFEFIQAWTKGRRDINFDTGLPGTQSYSSQFYSIKACWFIPLYKRKPKAYYLY
jgi:hypothetical protein